jgi:hypothetical protein
MIRRVTIPSEGAPAVADVEPQPALARE